MGNSDNNFIRKIFTNVYVRNIFLMLIVAFALIFITLFSLNIYTRHGDFVEVPDLSGLQIEEASAIVSSSGLKYEVIDSLYEKGGVPGAIADQIPNSKSKVKSGRVIYLTIQAKAPQMISIPDMEDNSYRQAEALLNALGFNQITKETIESEYKDLVFGVVYKGKVLRAGEKVPKGSPITLRVGSGTGQEEYIEPTPEIDSSAIDIDETFME